MKTEKDLFYEVAEMIKDHPDCTLLWDEDFKEFRYFLKKDNRSFLFLEGNPETQVLPTLNGEYLNSENKESRHVIWYLNDNIIVTHCVGVNEQIKETVQDAYEALINLLK